MSQCIASRSRGSKHIYQQTMEIEHTIIFNLWENYGEIHALKPILLPSSSNYISNEV
jgi:hypothetical protein